MNKTLKRTLCILSAALVMTAGFTSCSSKNGNGSGSGTSQTTDIAALRQELAYKVDTVKLPEGLKLDGGNVLYHEGDTLTLALGRRVDANGETLSKESKQVKKSYSRAINIPKGSISVRFTAMKATDAGTPVITSFAPKF